jgi:hypothetical protein|tara:strand:+ start:935 stop:1363 length:429 start_codon:yes stop_codon:yes gene_type:complete
MDKLEKIQANLNKNLPEKKVEKTEITKAQADVKSDYEFSRKTYKDLIETGVRSLDTLAELARESEHPRAFEVLSKAIKDIGDVTDKLMDLQKSNRDLTDGSKAKREVTNNNLFVGSTTDLQRLFMKHDKENKDRIIDATPKE